MTTTIDTNQWCSRFVKCKGCKLDAECMVKPEEMALVREDGKIVVTNGAIVIHTQRLKSDPGGNLLS